MNERIVSKFASPRDIFYVAVFCTSEDKQWFSPGRARKVEQVFNILSSLGCRLKGLNIANTTLFQRTIRIHNLCTSRFIPVRYLQLCLNSILFGLRSISSLQSAYLWLYNTRSAESVVALSLLLVRPKLSLVLQLEDLPSARKANDGLSGFLDTVSTRLLAKKASHVFAVSPSAALSFCRMVGYPVDKVSTLPPALHPSLIRKVQTRPDPFGERCISILYAGSYSHDKGVSDLINAFLTLPSGSLFRLLLAGPAPSDLRSQCANNNQIIFRGMLSTDELFELYTTADVVVNPHREVLNPTHIFPFKLVEIVASGALPLTTPVPGYETFGLPEECILRTQDDLALKLSKSRSIWHSCAHRIRTVASACRDHYSYQAIMAAVKAELSS